MLDMVPTKVSTPGFSITVLLPSGDCTTGSNSGAQHAAKSLILSRIYFYTGGNFLFQ